MQKMKRQRKKAEGRDFILESDVTDLGINANLWVAYRNKAGDPPSEKDFITGVAKPQMGLRYLMEYNGTHKKRRIGMYDRTAGEWHSKEEALSPSSRAVIEHDLRDSAVQERLKDPRVSWIEHPLVNRSKIAHVLFNERLGLGLSPETVRGKIAAKMKGRRPFTEQEMHLLGEIRSELINEVLGQWAARPVGRGTRPCVPRPRPDVPA